MICLLAGCQSTGSTTTEQPSTNPSPTETEENTPTPSPSPVPTPSPTETVVPQREDADFRNAKWGDDKETVIEYEADVDLIDMEDELIGEATVSGYDAYAIYSFNDDMLYQGAYMLNCQYTNPGQYIPAYDSLKENLTKKYGEPTEDVIIPLASQSLIELAGEGQALEYGYVMYRARWETETTNILLGMTAQNFEVGLVITYEDKNYEPDINDSGL